MRAPNEVRTVWTVEDMVLGIARDLLGLLLCVAFMAALLLFMARGL